MRISIAMATYNGAQYIQDQLESLSNQTLLPYELIVCDDGSTDGTQSLIREFSASSPFPVRFYQNETNLGFADNFLRAGSLCRGDWIAFCDQDDVWLPEKLERCALEFADNSVVFIVHSGEVVDRDLQPQGWQVPKLHQRTTRAALQCDPWGVFAGFATLIRRDVLALLNYENRPRHPFLPGERQSHDRWTYFLASVFGSTTVIPDSLVLYRQHANNIYGTKKASKLSFAFGRLKPNSDLLRRNMHSAAEHGEMLRLAAVTLLSPWRERAHAASNYYARLRAQLASRIEIHQCESSSIKRWAALIKNMRSKAYWPIERGGFGFKAFLRDFVICLVGPKALGD